MTTDTRIAIVESAYDVEVTDKPFGKRYRQEEIILTLKHLTALKNGGVIALDVQGEYVVFLKTEGSKK